MRKTKTKLSKILQIVRRIEKAIKPEETKKLSYEEMEMFGV